MSSQVFNLIAVLAPWASSVWLGGLLSQNIAGEHCRVYIEVLPISQSANPSPTIVADITRLLS